MTDFALDPLDLAALLCSRVCHDILNPVGAIINGLEVLEDEKDVEMRGFALDLIKRSAEQASAQLQFCRLAFGAAGSAGAAIDSGDAEKVARAIFDRERTDLRWKAPARLMPKNQVKLILNLCLIAAAAVPRRGVIEVLANGAGEGTRIKVSATGANPKLASQVPLLLAGTPDKAPSSPHDVQAYYTGLVAKAAGMSLTVAADGESVAFDAVPLQVGMAGEPAAIEASVS